jgi:hypothetical protein
MGTTVEMDRWGISIGYGFALKQPKLKIKTLEKLSSES